MGLTEIERDEYDDEDDEYSNFKTGFRNLLTLMIENQSSALFRLLDTFSYMVDFEDMVSIFSILS